uniref:Sushi domain-containing protein 3 n=1 Tax=Petromyzon marinus TaxID=7757 RepID=A0AAJ7T3R3_PETMA|nr:sushi domain-containing protein 3 [Petromyzon marinus]
MEDGDEKEAAIVREDYGEGVSCPDVAPPLGGWLSLESRNESLAGVGTAGGALAPGAVLLFACRAGYRLVGGARITCSLRDGTPTWSATPPVCQEDEMGYRVAVLASVVSGALILVLSTAFVSCCLRNRRLRHQQQRQQQRRHEGGHGEGMEFVEEREVGGRTGRERARGRGYDNVGFHGPDDALPTLCSAGYQIFPFAPGQPAPAGLPPGCIPIAVLALPLPDLPRHAAPPPPGPPGRASHPHQAGKARASRKCAR